MLRQVTKVRSGGISSLYARVQCALNVRTRDILFCTPTSEGQQSSVVRGALPTLPRAYTQYRATQHPSTLLPISGHSRYQLHSTPLRYVSMINNLAADPFEGMTGDEIQEKRGHLIATHTRTLLTRVHPDKFFQTPEKQALNSESLQVLNSFMDDLDSFRVAARRHAKQTPTSEAELLLQQELQREGRVPDHKHIYHMQFYSTEDPKDAPPIQVALQFPKGLIQNCLENPLMIDTFAFEALRYLWERVGVQVPPEDVEFLESDPALHTDILDDDNRGMTKESISRAFKRGLHDWINQETLARAEAEEAADHDERLPSPEMLYFADGLTPQQEVQALHRLRDASEHLELSRWGSSIPLVIGHQYGGPREHEEGYLAIPHTFDLDPLIRYIRTHLPQVERVREALLYDGDRVHELTGALKPFFGHVEHIEPSYHLEDDLSFLERMLQHADQHRDDTARKTSPTADAMYIKNGLPQLTGITIRLIAPVKDGSSNEVTPSISPLRGTLDVPTNITPEELTSFFDGADTELLAAIRGRRQEYMEYLSHRKSLVDTIVKDLGPKRIVLDGGIDIGQEDTNPGIVIMTLNNIISALPDLTHISWEDVTLVVGQVENFSIDPARGHAHIGPHFAVENVIAIMEQYNHFIAETEKRLAKAQGAEPVHRGPRVTFGDYGANVQGRSLWDQDESLLSSIDNDPRYEGKTDLEIAEQMAEDDPSGFYDNDTKAVHKIKYLKRREHAAHKRQAQRNASKKQKKRWARQDKREQRK